MAGDELYYFDLKNGENEASWAALTTSGKSPGKRYGHTLCCVHPNIILFGGNTGSSPSNDVYIISLSSKHNNSFTWNNPPWTAAVKASKPMCSSAAGLAILALEYTICVPASSTGWCNDGSGDFVQMVCSC